jgi:hypothetical protein
MDSTGVCPPFQRHQRTAETLLRTVQDALTPLFDAKGFVTRDDVERVVGRLTEMTDRTSLLFAQNCRACVDEPVPPGIRVALFDPQGRRNDYVTRLLFAHVLDRVPAKVDPVTGSAYPRLLAPALQATLSGLFYDMEWRSLNVDALTAFQKIGTTADKEIRERIDRDTALPIVVGSIFVRVLLRFRQFTYQRQSFTRRMSDLMRPLRFVFTEDHFAAVFDALAERLRNEIDVEFGRTRTDMHYGEGTAADLARILDEFDRFRQTLAERVTAPAFRPFGMSRRLMAAGAR